MICSNEAKWRFTFLTLHVYRFACLALRTSELKSRTPCNPSSGQNYAASKPRKHSHGCLRERPTVLSREVRSEANFRLEFSLRKEGEPMFSDRALWPNLFARAVEPARMQEKQAKQNSHTLPSAWNQIKGYRRKWGYSIAMRRRDSKEWHERESISPRAPRPPHSWNKDWLKVASREANWPMNFCMLARRSTKSSVYFLILV